MVMKSYEVFVDVNVELSDFGIEDLIDEVERRGYKVQTPDDIDEATEIEKCILNLKEDFINWYALGMKNENFEKILKEFFKDTVNEYIM